MVMPVAVRPARPSDGPAMGRVHVAAWQWAYAGVMDEEFLAALDAKARGTRWTDVLTEAQDSTTLVAEMGSTVVAICSIGPYRDRADDDPGMELWMLNAHPDAFGTGAAAALHTEAVARMAATGEDRAALWVVEHNPRARRFYEREGWEADGARRTIDIGGRAITEVRYIRQL